MMSSGSYWAYRDAGAFDCDPEDCKPDVKTLSSGTHTARKAQECNVCNGTIMPGQRYSKIVMIYEGEFQIDRHHADAGQCAAMRSEVEEWEARRYDDELLGADDAPF